MLWVISFFVICLIISIILQRNKLDFFAFLVSVITLFFLMLYLFDDSLEGLIITQIMWCFSYIGELSYIIFNKIPVFQVAKESQMLTIYSYNSIVTFFFDYECTGIIELLVYISMVISYPLFTNYLKIYRIIQGYLFLMLINILRVGIILVIIWFFGKDSIFVAHVVIARLFYFVMTVYLYYTVFTKQHIASQKVGGIR